MGSLTLKSAISLKAFACTLLGLTCTAILVIVFFPLFATNCRPSPTTLTVSNMKHSLQAFTAYVADYDETFPPPNTWQDAVESHTQIEYFYSVMDVRTARRPEFYFAASRPTLLKSLKRISNFESTILLFESNSCSRNTTGSFELLRDPSPERRRLVVGYLDGHVGLLRIPADIYTSIREGAWGHER